MIVSNNSPGPDFFVSKRPPTQMSILLISPSYNLSNVSNIWSKEMRLNKEQINTSGLQESRRDFEDLFKSTEF